MVLGGFKHRLGQHKLLSKSLDLQWSYNVLNVSYESDISALQPKVRWSSFCPSQKKINSLDVTTNTHSRTKSVCSFKKKKISVE